MKYTRQEEIRNQTKFKLFDLKLILNSNRYTDYYFSIVGTVWKLPVYKLQFWPFVQVWFLSGL